MNFLPVYKEVLELYRTILSSTDVAEIAEAFDTLKLRLQETPELFSFVIYPTSSSVEFVDTIEIEFDPQVGKFVLPNNTTIDPSQITILTVPTVGFQAIPPYRGEGFKDYLRKVLLAIAPDASPFIGDSISSAEEHVISMVSAIMDYIAQQVDELTSNFFPETAAGPYLVQIAAILGKHPSPPSPDVAIIRPTVPIDSQTSLLFDFLVSFRNRVLQSEDDSSLSEFEQKLTTAWNWIRTFLNALPSDPVSLQYPAAERTKFNAAVEALNKLTSELNAINSRSSRTFTVSVLLPAFEIEGSFVEGTFPRPYFPSLGLSGTESSVHFLRYIVRGVLTIRYRIVPAPDSTQTSKTVVLELLDATPVVNQFDLKYPSAVKIEIESITPKVTFNPTSLFEGIGVVADSQVVEAENFAVFELPPIDFTSLRSTPRILINPFAPAASVRTDAYILPIWDPTSQSTVVKIVTRDPVQVTLEYDIIQRITASSYTMECRVSKIKVTGESNAITGEFPSGYLTSAVQLYNNLPSTLSISPPPPNVSFSFVYRPSDIFGYSALLVALTGEVVSVTPGYSGDTVPELRAADIAFSRGILNEAGILDILHRNLPVLASLDVVAIQPPPSFPEVP